MGGSKRTLRGYMYYLGIHFVLCHGPVDNFTRLYFDDRLAWSGYTMDSVEYVNKPGLYGGYRHAGGVFGNMSINSGDPSQLQDDYLKSQLGDDVPAYRRLFSIVFRKMQLGFSPYLKRPSFMVSRIHKKSDGTEQWYDAKAQILNIETPLSLYFALDFSNSMNEITENGNTRYENMVSAMEQVLDALDAIIDSIPPIDIMIVGFGTDPSSRTSILKRTVDSADITALKNWFPSSCSDFLTYFPAGVMDATAFFSGGDSDVTKISIFVTDGEPYATGDLIAHGQIAQDAADLLFETSDVVAHGINIDLENTQYTAYLDNTNGDGIPVISGAESNELKNVVLAAISSFCDMNPVHIIRECLTDRTWGMGYSTDDIDSTSFTACANTIFTEKMGMSILWNGATRLKNFVDEICRHINAVIYIDRTSGKFVLKLIRDDYNVDTIFELNQSNITKISNFRRMAVADLTSEVTIVYTDQATDNDATVSARNIALANQQGAPVGTKLEFKGFTSRTIATLVANRELKQLSTPLAACDIYATQAASGLNLGDPVKLSYPRYGLTSVVFRVMAIEFGNLQDNIVKLNCVEDVFGTADIAYTVPPGSIWTPIAGDPAPVEYRSVIELPFWDLVRESTDELVADLDSDVGFLGATGVQPVNAVVNADLYIDSGAGYQEATGGELMDFCPTATLTNNISVTDTVIDIENTDNIDLVEVDTYALLEEEIVLIDAVSDSLTIKRGCGDTVPVPHSSGARLFFVQDYYASDNVEYVDGESIDVKMSPRTSTQNLNIAHATADTINFDSRQARPYPPGQFKINSDYFPEAASGDVVVSWVGRNRLTQSSALIDILADNVTPEAGTTYTCQVINNETDVVIDTQSGITANTVTFTEATLGSVYQARIELKSICATLDSWQSQTHTLLCGWSPDKVYEIIIDHTKIGTDLTHFSILIVLSSINADIFTELGANWKKLAVIKADGSQLYVEKEQWDNTNTKALLHASRSDFIINSSEDVKLYLRFDNSHADNNDFVGEAGVENLISSNITATVVDDDFTGTNGDSVDSSKWSTYYDSQDSGDSSGAVSIQSNQLNFLISSATTFPVCVSKEMLSGDFDIQVDFSMSAIPTPDNGWCHLFSVGSGTTSFFSDAKKGWIARYVTSIGPYRSATYNGSSSQYGTVHALSGKFRFIRTSNTLVSKYWEGGAWVTAQTDTSYGSHDVYVKMGSRNWILGISDMSFDNFKVNSGTIKQIVSQNVWKSANKAVFNMAQDPSGGASCIFDSTVNKNNVTPSGTMTTADLITGTYGQAIDFDGDDDLFDTSETILSGGAYTLQIGFNTSATATGDEYLAGQYNNGSGDGYALKLDSTGHVVGIHNDVSGDDNTITSTGSYNDGEDHVIDWVFEVGVGSSLYIDGVQEGSTDATIATDILSIASDFIIAGQDGAIPKNYESIINFVQLSAGAETAAWRKAYYYARTNNLLNITGDAFGFENGDDFDFEDDEIFKFN